jgi:hypothetical protein
MEIEIIYKNGNSETIYLDKEEAKAYIRALERDKHVLEVRY